MITISMDCQEILFFTIESDLWVNIVGKVEDMKRVTEEIICSYESRIGDIGKIIDDTHHLLNILKTKRMQMNIQLQETLAREGSLRKKDYDSMMEDIFSHQDTREKQIRTLLKNYLEEQKNVARSIHDNFKNNRTLRAEEEKTRIAEFRNVLNEIQEKQKSREKEIREMLKQFRQEHRETAESLQELLRKGESVRVKDLKALMKNIQVKRIERREEIKQMGDQWREFTDTMKEKRDEMRRV